MRKLFLAVTAVFAIGAAQADNGLIYVGGGVTSNSVKSSSASLAGGAYHPFPDISATSWEAFAGVRPIRALAFEVTYFDMGSASSAYYSPLSCVGSGSCGTNWHVDAKALAGNVVGFLPVPVPHLELFAKAGVASYTLNRNGNSLYISPVSGAQQTTYYNFPDKSTVFTWGVGLGLQFGHFGGRLEYTSLDKASTGIFSLALFVSFL